MYAGGWGDLEEMPASVDFSKYDKHSGFIKDDNLKHKGET